MNDMTAASWASPGGVLAGARDLGAAFMGYPVQAAQVQQRRAAADEDRRRWEQTFGLQQQQAQDLSAQRQQAAELARMEGIFQGFVPPAEGYAMDPVQHQRQAREFLGYDPDDASVAVQVQAPELSHEQRVARDGQLARAAKQDLLSAQAEAARRGPAGRSVYADMSAYSTAQRRFIGDRPKPPDQSQLALGLPEMAKAAQDQYAQELLMWDARRQEFERTYGPPPSGAMPGPADAFTGADMLAPGAPRPPGPSLPVEFAGLEAIVSQLQGHDRELFDAIVAENNPQKLQEVAARLRRLAGD